LCAMTLEIRIGEHVGNMNGAAVDNCSPKDGAAIRLFGVARKMIYPFGAT
jgi:hypothetical protein